MRLPPDLAILETPRVGLMPFGGALRLFGSDEASLPALDRWNDAQLWIAEYGALAEGLAFFAEDALGNQFAWDGADVVRFTAETGSREWMSETAAAWANIVADDQDRWLARFGDLSRRCAQQDFLAPTSAPCHRQALGSS